MAEIKLHEPQFLTDQIKDEVLALREQGASLSVVNKYIKNIEDERLKYTRQLDAHKKEIMQIARDALAPAYEFHAELNEIKLNEEETRKNEKLAIIRNLDGFVFYEMWRNLPDKWFNKTYAIENIQEDINVAVAEISADLQQVQELCDQLNMPVHSEYFNMLHENPLESVLQFIRRDHIVILNYLGHHGIDEPVVEPDNVDSV